MNRFQNFTFAKVPRSLFRRIIGYMLVNALITSILVFSFSRQYLVDYHQTVEAGITASLDSAVRAVDNVFDDFLKIGTTVGNNGTGAVTGSAGALLAEYPFYLKTDEFWQGDVSLRFLQTYTELQNNLILATTLHSTAGEYAVVVHDTEDTLGILVSDQVLGTPERINRIGSFTNMVNHGVYQFQKPHQSVFADEMVLSMTYSLNPKYGVILYLETPTSYFQTIFYFSTVNCPVYGVIANRDGEIMYTQLPEQSKPADKLDCLEQSGYILMGDSRSGHDLKFYAALAKSDYERLMHGWNSRFILLNVASFILMFSLNMILYWSIYRGILKLKTTIRETENSVEIAAPEYFGVQEFDLILRAFYDSRERNIELLRKIDEKEKLELQLEYEKLMLQINPHFIQNSLNSIQWMARINHQEEIGKMVTNLVKVFNYNLQEKLLSTLSDEITVTRAYMELQMMRYGSQLNVEYCVNEEDGMLPVPRFLLQPLLENAILYGRDKAGNNEIIVSVYRDAEKTYVLSVRDSGVGFTEELKKQLLNGEIQSGTGLGIGLRYVLNVLGYYHGSVLDVRKEERGSRISLRLPVDPEEVAE